MDPQVIVQIYLNGILPSIKKKNSLFNTPSCVEILLSFFSFPICVLKMQLELVVDSPVAIPTFRSTFFST